MARPLLALLLVVLLTVPAAAQPLQWVLIGPNTTYDKALDGKELTPKCPTAWTIRQEKLHGGKQEGSRLLVLDNGKLQITLIPTRGLGILDVRLGELRLGWDSPVKEVVNPAHMNLLARGGLGWLEGFNEWLCRCGLENIGQPGKDEIITNTGARAEVDLTLHGKIATIPAAQVEVLVDPKAPHRITVRGRVVEAMVFGPNLELTTEVSTEPGSKHFQIKDTVKNLGGQVQEFQLLYHFNFGRPLLEEGARLWAPVARVTPFNARAAEDVKTFDRFAGPRSGYVEQVYLLRPLSDDTGRMTVLLHNKHKDRGASLQYSVKELPYLSLWKNTGDPRDGYVIGIEPGTSYPSGRRYERSKGRVPKLAAGASQTMTLEIGLHDDEASVEQMIRQIQLTQLQQQPRIDLAPEKE
jgi:hypothetical protein